MSTTLDDLKAEVDTLKSRMDVIESRRDGDSMRLIDNNRLLSRLAGDVFDFRTQLSDLKAEVKAEVANNLGQLQQKVDHLYDPLMFTTSNDIGDLFRDVREIKEGVEELRTGATEVKQDVAGLKQEVAGLRRDMSHHSTRVELLAEVITRNSSNVEVLKQDVGGLKQDVGGLKQDVGGLKQDVADLKLGLGAIMTHLGVQVPKSLPQTGEAGES